MMMKRKYIPPFDTLILIDTTAKLSTYVYVANFDSKHPTLTTPRIRPGYPHASKLIAYKLNRIKNGEEYYDYHFTIYYTCKVYSVYPISVTLESIINKHETFRCIP